MRPVKNTILGKSLTVTLLTVILSAALTAIAFNFYGRTVFTRIKAQEMAPRAEFIAELTGEYLQGYITAEMYGRAIGSGYHIWDAAVYVYNARGELMVYPKQEELENVNALLSAYLPDVMEGHALYSPNSDNQGVIIAEPVYSRFDNVIGAVFLIKPLGEVRAAINSLLVALLISMAGVMAIMAAPIYVFSSNLVRPIRKMRDIATAMAGGDFSIRAPEQGSQELQSLGRSLNYLSATLSATIEDLTFERNRLVSTLNGLREGIISFDAQGQVQQKNPAAWELLGLKAEEQIGVCKLWPSLQSGLDAVLEGKEAPVQELPWSETTLRCTYSPLEEGSRIEGAVLLIQDVTEAARLEKTRRDYVANVSHELRTPLASIRGLADALNDGLVQDPKDQARYYGYILHESMRLSRLIDDLLELSRLQSGAVALTKQPLRVDELVYDVADRYEAAAREKGCRVQISVPEHCPKAYANPDRTEQVLIALLDNAIKHGEGNGAICLGVLDQGEKLEVRVSNQGEIQERDLAHLFERFYKVDQSHSGGGTGLGLSIAYEIMTRMGERIWVESLDGTVTFAFTLSKPGDGLAAGGKNGENL